MLGERVGWKIPQPKNVAMINFNVIVCNGIEVHKTSTTSNFTNNNDNKQSWPDHAMYFL